MMTDQNASVATTPVVTDNRSDATQADAIVLSKAYLLLDAASKAVKTTTKDVSEAWASLMPDAISNARKARNDAVYALDNAMDEAWVALKELPKGTVASGGATPQTIGLQFFNGNLNRTLKSRLTASQAREINKRSFS